MHIVHSVATTTHGRVLARPARSRPARGVLAGFHGYSETAAIQMARLEAVPGADDWTLISVQGLHRFYRGRTQQVGASWMTREDRDTAIADNLAYVAAAVRLAGDDAQAGVVYAGFSQGVAMAFRAALLAPGPSNLEPGTSNLEPRTPNLEPRVSGIIAVGGDVPPELLADPALTFPPLFLARGSSDEWYTASKFDADVATLAARGVTFETFVYDAPHEWTPAVSQAAGAWLDRIPHR